MDSLSLSDWMEFYNDKVSASKNKKRKINRWYPILEGFSNNFVELVLKEQENMPSLCLDPFAGGGTTPLTAQLNGVRCISFEVSPFMSQVCRSKLRNDYKFLELQRVIDDIEEYLSKPINHGFEIGLKTISKKEGLDKWLFHKTALDSLLSIRKAIDVVSGPKYKDLLYVTLGSILLNYCNASRDGKALRYRENWERKVHKRKTIYRDFLTKCREEVLPDVKSIEEEAKKNPLSNLKDFYSGDCRQLTHLVADNSIDVIITSPPYLNSRDYTDSHMVELWLLGHVTSYSDVANLRRKTMRSHVQVRWGESPLPNSELLRSAFHRIMSFESEFWNKNIPNMISGYFSDLEELLFKLKPKMRTGGKIYINVANSSYFGVVIETDKIIAEIAQNLGYTVLDIRIARRIKCSSQQSDEIKWLRESVVVLMA
ncbi:DNA methyltransferase [Effusibacillus lacus]|uniref:site-specific DNA-methyltransferase (cytosine-N(4)-specific) n=1 Tax=Effusibacillus lacus TaxID=1348429 RepID=A0A292YF38_9BACL|nr:DNA methyltransferase [Effusibacillus lacus]TCS68546.1 DNA methylase [Effusibacillus lacus]GAX88427.1 hypothetical protein EFBL_0036 [Effusibacillus lacus]